MLNRGKFAPSIEMDEEVDHRRGAETPRGQTNKRRKSETGMNLKPLR